MTIKTLPVFYFVSPVDESNNLVNFVEPNVSIDGLTATLNVASRSMTDLMTEFERALNDAGSQEYTFTFDRDTRLVTITSTDIFELLPVSGSNAGLSSLPLIGFTTDRSGLSVYVADLAMGSQYLPQFLPQKFKSFDDNLEGVLASVNESASGVIEVITFGNRRFMEMNLKYITNRSTGKGGSITNNPNALSEARTFLEFLITKSNLEYMADSAVRSSFEKVLLESTRKSKQGTAYQLRELIGEGFDDYFETGTLTFRKVE